MNVLTLNWRHQNNLPGPDGLRDLKTLPPSSMKHSGRNSVYFIVTVQLGYKVSKKKTQICSPQITYLGYELREGKILLSQAHIATIMQIPIPTTKKQVRDFLGAVGYCYLLMPGFAEFAKPLYSAMTRGIACLWNGLRNMKRPLGT